jgi:hypothetical protein
MIKCSDPLCDSKDVVGFVATRIGFFNAVETFEFRCERHIHDRRLKA